MPDEVITARAANGAVRVTAATTTALVTETQVRHDLSPTASAAVGRLMSGAVLLAASLKNGDRVSLQIAGSGPLGGIVADAAVLERTIGGRAYARVPTADLPLNARGKFDVGGAVGSGTLHVTKSFSVGQPYVGIVPLVTGEIGDDIAAYLWDSEQIPSIVALGVLANHKGIVAAGGVIAQILPGADERIITQLESHAQRMQSVTAQMAAGANAETLARNLAGDLDINVSERLSVEFKCFCSRQKVEVALLGLGRDQLEQLAKAGEDTEAICEYCKTRYYFAPNDVIDLLERAS